MLQTISDNFNESQGRYLVLFVCDQAHYVVHVVPERLDFLP